MCKRSRAVGGVVLPGISHPHPQDRADREAPTPGWIRSALPLPPSAGTGGLVQLPHSATGADGLDKTNRHQVPSFANEVMF